MADTLIGLPNFDKLEIVKTGNTTLATASVTAAGAGLFASDIQSVVIPHGLNYVPIVMAYITTNGLFIPLPTPHSSASSTSVVSWTTAYCYTDQTYIYFITEITTLNWTLSTGGVPVKYYLLRQTASSSS